MARTFLLLSLLIALTGCGSKRDRMIRSLPEQQQQLFRILDVFMTEDQQEIYLSAPSEEARQVFLEETELIGKWDGVEDEVKPVILAGDVQPGMSQDEVYMAWDRPVRIRRTFVDDAYVEALVFVFERDRRTGQVFVSPPDSTTAYANGTFERWVYLENDAVARIDVPGETDPSITGGGTTNQGLDSLPEDREPTPEVEETPAEETPAEDGSDLPE